MEWYDSVPVFVALNLNQWADRSALSAMLALTSNCVQ